MAKFLVPRKHRAAAPLAQPRSAPAALVPGAAGLVEAGAARRSRRRRSWAGCRAPAAARGRVPSTGAATPKCVGRRVPSRTGPGSAPRCRSRGRVALQVDVAVFVEVDAVAQQAGGHELRHAHRAGVAAQRLGGSVLRWRQRRKASSSLRKKGVVAPARGKIEGQRGQRRRARGKPRYCGLWFRRRRCRPRSPPARLSAASASASQRSFSAQNVSPADALRLDEACAVGGPVFRRAGRRRHDEPRHRRHEAARASTLARPGRIEPLALRGVLGESASSSRVRRRAAAPRPMRGERRGCRAMAARRRRRGLQGESTGGDPRLARAAQVRGHREVVAARLRVAAAKPGQRWVGRAVPRAVALRVHRFEQRRPAARRRCPGARARAAPACQVRPARRPLCRYGAARRAAPRWRVRDPAVAVPTRPPPMSASVECRDQQRGQRLPVGRLDAEIPSRRNCWPRE